MAPKKDNTVMVSTLNVSCDRNSARVRQRGGGRALTLAAVCFFVAAQSCAAMTAAGGGDVGVGSLAHCTSSDCKMPALRGGAAMTSAQAEKAMEANKPRIMRRVNSHPLLRVKSFGELSSIEYDGLIDELWKATIAGNLDEVFSLVKKGAWPNHQRVGSSLQTNALQLAAIHGHDELIELLVHLGADVNLPNNQGMTALHMASQLGLIKVVKTLLALGADPHIMDWMQETPEEKAEMAGHTEVAVLFRKIEADEHTSFLGVHQHMRADMHPKKQVPTFTSVTV